VKKLLVVITVLLLILPGISRSQEDGGSPGAFLRLGVGAKALGMGRAFTAIANDASAAYWNPAGLGGLRMMEFMGSYSILSMDRQHNYIAFLMPLKSLGTIGVSWINLGVGEIEGRDSFGQVTEMFSNNETAISLSWGYPVFESLYLGVTAKYLSHTLEDNRSAGLGFDAGFLYKIADVFHIGASVRDIATSVTWDTQGKTKETFPLETRLGGAYYHPTIPLIVGLDYVMNANQKATIHMGAEMGLASLFGVRLGFDNGGIALGGSISVPLKNLNFQTDYCLARDPIDATYSHKFSLQVKFSPLNYTFQSDRDLTGKYNNRFLNTMTPLPDARIIKTLSQYPNIAMINIGQREGVINGTVFEVHRVKYPDDSSRNGDRSIIGTVEVIRVKETVSAVRIVQINDGFLLRVGDFVVVSGTKE
jgi:hypothetical protein